MNVLTVEEVFPLIAAPFPSPGAFGADLSPQAGRGAELAALRGAELAALRGAGLAALRGAELAAGEVRI